MTIFCNSPFLSFSPLISDSHCGEHVPYRISNVRILTYAPCEIAAFRKNCRQLCRPPIPSSHLAEKTRNSSTPGVGGAGESPDVPRYLKYLAPCLRVRECVSYDTRAQWISRYNRARLVVGGCWLAALTINPVSAVARDPLGTSKPPCGTPKKKKARVAFNVTILLVEVH